MKYVIIELDKKRRLRYDLNALMMAQDLLGVDIFEAETWQTISMRNLRGLLWAGLLHEDADLTVETVGQMIDVNNFAHASEKFIEAWALASPAEKKTITKPAIKAAKKSTG